MRILSPVRAVLLFVLLGGAVLVFVLLDGQVLFQSNEAYAQRGCCMCGGMCPTPWCYCCQCPLSAILTMFDVQKRMGTLQIRGPQGSEPLIVPFVVTKSEVINKLEKHPINKIGQFNLKLVQSRGGEYGRLDFECVDYGQKGLPDRAEDFWRGFNATEVVFSTRAAILRAIPTHEPDTKEDKNFIAQEEAKMKK